MTSRTRDNTSVDIDLKTQVSGILPVTNGGTGLGTTAGFVTTTGEQTIAGAKTFTSGVLLPTTGGTPTALSNYSEFTMAQSWSGPMVATPGDIQGTVIGRIVYLSLPGTQVAGNSVGASIVGANPLPAWLWPSTLQRIATIVISNSSTRAGSIQIGTNGVMNMYIDAFTTNFAAGTGVQGFVPVTVCYTR